VLRTPLRPERDRGQFCCEPTHASFETGTELRPDCAVSIAPDRHTCFNEHGARASPEGV